MTNTYVRPGPFNERSVLLRKGQIGVDSLVDEILTTPNGPKAQLYLRAQELHDSKIKKQYTEASLIACSDLKMIAELLETEEDVIKMYADVYYNVVGYSKLGRLDLLDKVRDRDELILKTWALHQGIEFIAWRLGKKVNVQPTEGLEELFTTCLYKAKEALFNPNSSMASIESTKWVKLSIDIARLLKLWVLDSASAKRDLELAIKEVVPTFRSLDDLFIEAGLEDKEHEENDKDGNE